MRQIQSYPEPRSEAPLTASALDFPELAVASRWSRSDHTCAIARTPAVDIHRQPGCRRFDINVSVPGVLDIPQLTLRVGPRPLYYRVLILPIQVQHLAAGHIFDLIAAGARVSGARCLRPRRGANQTDCRNQHQNPRVVNLHSCHGRFLLRLKRLKRLIQEITGISLIPKNGRHRTPNFCDRCC